jgi:DNA end-binding protein Ku
MAPRANWKGFLRLSLVTCPIALYPATSESEKISFNQLNRKTGHRIKYAKVDADTGEEVANENSLRRVCKLTARLMRRWSQGRMP